MDALEFFGLEKPKGPEEMKSKVTPLLKFGTSGFNQSPHWEAKSNALPNIYYRILIRGNGRFCLDMTNTLSEMVFGVPTADQICFDELMKAQLYYECIEDVLANDRKEHATQGDETSDEKKARAERVRKAIQARWRRFENAMTLVAEDMRPTIEPKPVKAPWYYSTPPNLGGQFTPVNEAGANLETVHYRSFDVTLETGKTIQVLGTAYRISGDWFEFQDQHGRLVTTINRHRVVAVTPSVTDPYGKSVERLIACGLVADHNGFLDLTMSEAKQVVAFVNSSRNVLKKLVGFVDPAIGKDKTHYAMFETPTAEGDPVAKALLEKIAADVRERRNRFRAMGMSEESIREIERAEAAERYKQASQGPYTVVNDLHNRTQGKFFPGHFHAAELPISPEHADDFSPSHGEQSPGDSDPGKMLSDPI